MKVQDIAKALASNGGELIRQRGSHQRWRLQRNGKTAFTTIPAHRGDVPIGTAKAIERDLEELLGKVWLL